jgi:hypothetical protein
MYNMIKADIYKMFKMKSVLICILASIICAVGIAIMLHGVFQGTITLDASSAFALLSDTMIVMVLGSVLTGMLICGSFESKNIHDEIACGNGRFAIIVTKTISVFLFIILLTLPYVLLSTIGFASSIGFGRYMGIPSAFFNILSNVPGVEVSSSSIQKSIILGLLITLTYLAKISLCIPIAFKTRKSIAVILIGFVATFAFDILIALTKNVHGMEIFKYLPYHLGYQLTLDCSVNVMVQSAISSIVFIAWMLSITYQIFRKAEIK